MNAPIEIRTGNTTLENILKLKSFESTINIENSCAIMIAIQYSDTNTVKLLIDNGADVVTENGDTPLHYAAMYGRLGIVQMLIAKGVDVNANFFEFTPLHCAAYEGHKEIIELLIAKGANVNTITSGPIRGDTALDWAVNNNNTEIADLLRKNGGKTGEELMNLEGVKESIHAAARVGHIEAVKEHLEVGTDVNAKGEIRGATPLHWAVKEGHKEISELLIKKGADVNAKEDDIVHFGVTPLHWAVEEGHKEISELLIKKGADVNAKSVLSRTPLDISIEEGHTEIADLLRKHGGKTGEELKAASK